MDFRPVHLPIARLREINVEESEKKIRNQKAIALLRQEAKDASKQNEDDNHSLSVAQIKKFPSEMVQTIDDGVQEMLITVTEGLSLENVASSVKIMLTKRDNHDHEGKAMNKISKLIEQIQPETIAKKHLDIENKIVTAVEVQAALRSELRDQIESKRNDHMTFVKEMKRNARINSKIGTAGQLMTAKEREMKYLLKAQSQQKLTEKRLMVERLKFECRKLSREAPERQPVWLKLTVDTEDGIDMDEDEDEDEDEATDEDYDGDED